LRGKGSANVGLADNGASRMAIQHSSVVIRPSAMAFAKRAALGLAVAVPLLVFKGMVGTHQLGLTLWILIAISTTAVLALIAAIYFLNVRVVVSDEQVIVRAMTGRERRWPRRTVQGCLLVSVLGVGPRRLIVVHGAHQQLLFTLTADLWDDRALRALTHALGYRHQDSATFRPIYKADLLERYPGALSFSYRHFWTVGLGGGVLFGLIFIAVGVTVQNLLQGRG
jgi:hypothetical protein